MFHKKKKKKKPSQLRIDAVAEPAGEGELTGPPTLPIYIYIYNFKGLKYMNYLQVLITSSR